MNVLMLMIDALLTFRDSLQSMLPALSETAGALLVTAIWQGAVVAAFLAICLRLTNRLSAAFRFSIWVAGFIAVIGLPFLPFVLRLAPSSQLAFANEAPRPWIQLDMRWSVAITLCWAIGSLYRTIDLAIHSVRLHRLWKSATSIEYEFAAQNPIRLWGRKPLQICTTAALDRPSVIGFLAPRILIPEWLYAKLTPGELEQILLHETEHLRRGDDWTNLLQKLSLILFPLNPALLWIERKLCFEREMACDEAVIRITRAPRAYAACLASLAERGLKQRAEALSLGAWQRRPELVQRVHSILLRRELLGPLGTRSLLATMACGLIFASVELSRCPQLVAFTTLHPAETAQLTTAPSHPDLRAGSARFGDAAVVPVSAHMSAANRPYLTELRATMPVRRNDKPLPVRYDRGIDDAPAQTLPPQPAPRTLARITPKPLLLKAEIPSSAPAITPGQPQQSWIVLTTWEEIETIYKTPNENTTETAANDSGNAQSPVEAANREQDQAQPTGKLTVTRLVFRILPAGSAPASSIPAGSITPLPAALVPVRNGWLVVQL